MAVARLNQTSPSSGQISGQLSMSLFSSASRPTRSILALTRFIAPLLLIPILLGPEGWAKEQPLNAIVLYDTDKGAAYEQVTDLLINGKIEVRACTTGQQI